MVQLHSLLWSNPRTWERYEGLRPASMWQWPQLADLLQKGLRTVAFHQASFGTPYAKPTRLLLRTSPPMPDFVYEGLPRYDPKGCYTGPLPSAQGRGAMFQRQARGAFKTSGSEQWPAKLCQWLSAMLVSTCLHAANAAVGEGDHAEHAETLPPTSETFPLNHAEGPRVLGGTGPPRFCRQLGGGNLSTMGAGYARLAGGRTTPGAICRWPTVGMAKEKDARAHPREGGFLGTAREGGLSYGRGWREGLFPR